MPSHPPDDVLHWRERALTAEGEVRRLQAEREALMRRYGLLDPEPPRVACMAVYGDGGVDDDEGSRGDTIEILAWPERVRA